MLVDSPVYHWLLYTDHVYTNVPQCVQSAGTLESYYSDHKSIYTSIKGVWIFVHNFQCVSYEIISYLI